jgi:hypothetical protein
MDPRMIVGVAAAVLVLLLLGALALADDGAEPTAAGDGTQQPAAAATPAPKSSPLTDEMRAVAGRVDDPGNDGAKGPQAAARLRAMADRLDAGQAQGAEATALANDALAWRANDELGRTASGLVAGVAAKVPGYDAASVAPPPPSNDDDDDRPGPGKKKKDKGDNDD